MILGPDELRFDGDSVLGGGGVSKRRIRLFVVDFWVIMLDVLYHFGQDELTI